MIHTLTFEFDSEEISKDWGVTIQEADKIIEKWLFAKNLDLTKISSIRELLKKERKIWHKNYTENKIKQVLKKQYGLKPLKEDIEELEIKARKFGYLIVKNSGSI